MILTEEQFKEFQKHGTIDGQPIEAYEPRKCSQCGTPIGQNNKPHNKRPDRTDDRCTACVEVPKVEGQIEGGKRERRIKKMTDRIVRNVEKRRRDTREGYRRRSRRSRSARS